MGPGSVHVTQQAQAVDEAQQRARPCPRPPSGDPRRSAAPASRAASVRRSGAAAPAPSRDNSASRPAERAGSPPARPRTRCAPTAPRATESSSCSRSTTSSIESGNRSDRNPGRASPQKSRRPAPRRGRRLPVETDADERPAARRRRPPRAGQRDPDVVDAAGPFPPRIAPALVRGQRLGDAHAAGNWILRQVEVDGRFRWRAE